MHYTKLVLLDGQKKDKRQKDKQQSTKHYTENYRCSNNLKIGLTSDIPWMAVTLSKWWFQLNHKEPEKNGSVLL
jgi:hypothetical protein